MVDTASVLLADLSKTQRDVDAFNPYVQTLDKDLNGMIKVATIPKNISDKLNQLHELLLVVDGVLLVLTPIPVVGEGAAPAKTAVDTIQKVVDPVRSKANDFEAKVKPVREKLQALEAKVKQVITYLQKLKNAAAKGYNTITGVKECIKGHPKLEKGLETFSKATDPPVAAVNMVLEAATDVCAKINDALKQVEAACKFMQPIEKDIDKVLGELKVLQKACIPINKVLDQDIKIPYTVQIKVKVNLKKKWWMAFTPWKWSWKASTKYFEFTVKKILHGIDTGIKAVTDELMSLAKSALKKVNIKLPTISDIPGLKDLEGKIKDVIGHVTALNTEVGKLEHAVGDIVKGAHALDVAVNGFHIECP